MTLQDAYKIEGLWPAHPPPPTHTQTDLCPEVHPVVGLKAGQGLHLGGRLNLEPPHLLPGVLPSSAPFTHNKINQHFRYSTVLKGKSFKKLTDVFRTFLREILKNPAVAHIMYIDPYFLTNMSFNLSYRKKYF